MLSLLVGWTSYWISSRVGYLRRHTNIANAFIRNPWRRKQCITTAVLSHRWRVLTVMPDIPTQVTKGCTNRNKKSQCNCHDGFVEKYPRIAWTTAWRGPSVQFVTVNRLAETFNYHPCHCNFFREPGTRSWNLQITKFQRSLNFVIKWYDTCLDTYPSGWHTVSD